MPGFYRKKKRKVGPSKNEEKVQRGREAEAEAQSAGTLASRFPGVRALRVKISVTSPQGVVLEENEDQLDSNDPFIINTDCPGRCGSGSYDFAEPVSAALTNREDAGAAQAVCEFPLYGGGPGTCGCIAKCEFEADFAPN